MENSQQNYIVIIGGGIDQLPMYQKAKAMGYPVAGVDINPQAPALRYADQTIIAASRDPGGNLKAIERFGRKFTIAGVLTIADDHVDTVAHVCDHFGLPGPSSDTAKLCRNKSDQLKVLRNAGIKVPRTFTIHNVEHLEHLIAKRRKPVIIKPADNRGVILVNRNGDIRGAYRHCRTKTQLNYILMQDFIEGRQISAEGFVINGRSYTAMYSDRNYELMKQIAPFVIENGGNLPADLSHDEKQCLDDTVRRAASALGINNGPIKGDLVINQRGIYALEFTARLGGGYASSHSIPLVHNIDLINLNLRFCLGEPIVTESVTPRFQQYAALRFFFPKPGRITAIYGFNDLNEKPWVKLSKLYCCIGDHVSAYSDHSNRAGCVLAVGTSRLQAEQRAREAANQVRILTA